MRGFFLCENLNENQNQYYLQNPYYILNLEL
jgi:hypothetical protein